MSHSGKKIGPIQNLIPTLCWNCGQRILLSTLKLLNKKKNSVFISPQANYTDEATAAAGEFSPDFCA
jgi:hypothetical protein